MSPSVVPIVRSDCLAGAESLNTIARRRVSGTSAVGGGELPETRAVPALLVCLAGEQCVN